LAANILPNDGFKLNQTRTGFSEAAAATVVVPDGASCEAGCGCCCS